MKEILNGIFTTINDDIYVIGDIHGDYQCLIHCLVDLTKTCYISKVYNDKEFDTNQREYLKWQKNNSSVIVFCGDLIHRKRFIDHVLDDESSDVYIIKSLLRLKKDAIKNGGDIIIISGNHEIMNIIRPDEYSYTSDKNIKYNNEYFNNNNYINYIENSYAWIKINNILLAHGGLCSDYLNYLDNTSYELKGNDIIDYINTKYRTFFKNIDLNNLEKDKISYDLFVNYDFNNKKKHNLFWCREWGYGSIDCDKFNIILNRVACNRMIISHCPQFLSPDKPKMINFECLDINSNKYNLARVDLGMSRCFEYNKKDNFIFYLGNNYNRKISILKLNYDNNKELYFDEKGIITYKLSCIQYLLLKYGIKLKDWQNKNFSSDWIGFDFIESLYERISDIEKKKFVCESSHDDIADLNESDKILLCLLYPIYMNNIKLNSINQFNKSI